MRTKWNYLVTNTIPIFKSVVVSSTSIYNIKETFWIMLIIVHDVFTYLQYIQAIVSVYDHHSSNDKRDVMLLLLTKEDRQN